VFIFETERLELSRTRTVRLIVARSIGQKQERFFDAETRTTKWNLGNSLPELESIACDLIHKEHAHSAGNDIYC
jgi:hypothetical protein